MAKKYTVLFLLIIAVTTTGIGLSSLQYYPGEMKSTAIRFSKYLRDYNVTEAYKLMHPNSRAGKKYKIFKGMLDRSIYRTKSHLPSLTHVKYRSLFPFQSYGNKLRRWVFNSNLRINKYEVEMFFFRGLNDKIPMGIRVTLMRYSGGWRVVRTYLHAW